MMSRSEHQATEARPRLPPRMSKVVRSRTDRDATTALGKRIAVLRKKKNLTQVELSELIGVSQSRISYYEIGRIRPPHEFIAKIAEALDVTSDEIFGIEKRPASTDNDQLERRFIRRLRLVKDLPKRDQDALLRTMDAFLRRTK